MSQNIKPKPKKARGIRFDEQTWQALERLSNKDGSKPSDHVRWAVGEYLQRTLFKKKK